MDIRTTRVKDRSLGPLDTVPKCNSKWAPSELLCGHDQVVSTAVPNLIGENLPKVHPQSIINIQGPNCTGKTHRIWKFCHNTGNLVCSSGV